MFITVEQSEQLVLKISPLSEYTHVAVTETKFNLGLSYNYCDKKFINEMLFRLQ